MEIRTAAVYRNRFEELWHDARLRRKSHSHATAQSNTESNTVDKLADVSIPEFPILAPGQEWRTIWDHSPSRKKYQDKWQRLAETSDARLTDQEKLERERQLAQSCETPPDQVFKEKFLPSQHTATVTYKDSHGKKYETQAILDSDMYKGTTWVDIKTVHDLTKMLDKHLKEQIKGLDAIHRRLAEFGTEHEGIWIYGSGDDDERDYRRRVAEEDERERQDFMNEIYRAQQRGRERLTAQNPKDQPESEQTDETTIMTAVDPQLSATLDAEYRELVRFLHRETIEIIIAVESWWIPNIFRAAVSAGAGFDLDERDTEVAKHAEESVVLGTI